MRNDLRPSGFNSRAAISIWEWNYARGAGFRPHNTQARPVHPRFRMSCARAQANHGRNPRPGDYQRGHVQVPPEDVLSGAPHARKGGLSAPVAPIDGSHGRRAGGNRKECLVGALRRGGHKTVKRMRLSGRDRPLGPLCPGRLLEHIPMFRLLTKRRDSH